MTPIEPTPEQVAMARRIVKDTLDPARHSRCRCRAEIDAGEWDEGQKIKIALAAIIETTERAAKLAEKHSAARHAAKADAISRRQRGAARDHESMAIEGIHIATALRTQEHLK